MVVIRLARAGSKKSPFYHVIVTDRRNRRDGRFIERLGYFNPVAKGNAIYLSLQKERIDHWIKTGAQTTERVTSLLREFAKMGDQPIIANTMPVKIVKKKAAAVETAATEVAAPETAVAETATTAEVAEAPAAEETKATEE